MVRKSQLGFTLIEILVVMAILAILSAIGIGSFQSSQQKARDSERKSSFKQIGIALETYYNDYSQYPTGSGGDIYGCGVDGIEACTWGSSFNDDKGTVYMVELPDDQRVGRSFYYESDGSYWQLYASLENDLDIDVPKDASGNPQFYSGTTCQVGVCNYGVSSANITVESGHPLVTE